MTPSEKCLCQQKPFFVIFFFKIFFSLSVVTLAFLEQTFRKEGSFVPPPPKHDDPFNATGLFILHLEYIRKPLVLFLGSTERDQLHEMG